MLNNAKSNSVHTNYKITSGDHSMIETEPNFSANETINSVIDH